MASDPKSAGTRFPFINLEKALGRAKELFDADQKGREMALSAAFSVWEYSEKSSGGFQTVAALKMYGLLRSGDTRKVGLTDAALRYFRDEREEEKNKLAREFALKPKLIAALWTDWRATPPADTIARSHLKTDRGVNDQGSRSLLSIYKENLAFTQLKADDKVPEPSEDDQDDTETMTPHTEPSSQSQSGSKAAPYRVGMNIFHDQPPEGMRREVITLDEGDVVITFPDSLTVESFGDLKAHLDLFISKMKRRTAGVPRHVVRGETPPKTILGSVGEEEEPASDEETEPPIKRRKIP
jgi:hypothetical protein